MPYTATVEIQGVDVPARPTPLYDNPSDAWQFLFDLRLTVRMQVFGDDLAQLLDTGDPVLTAIAQKQLRVADGAERGAGVVYDTSTPWTSAYMVTEV